MNYENRLKYIINLLFQSCYVIIYLLVLIFILSGSIASFILLYKTYPDLALGIFNELFRISNALLLIFRILAIAFLVAFVVLICLRMREMFNKSKERRTIRRDKFLDDLVVKLKQKGIEVTHKKK